MGLDGADSLFDLTCSDMTDHAGDVRKGGTGPPAGSFAVSYMFTEEQFQGLPSSGYDRFAARVDGHALLSRSRARRYQPVGLHMSDQAHHAGGLGLVAIEMTQNGNLDPQ